MGFQPAALLKGSGILLYSGEGGKNDVSSLNSPLKVQDLCFYRQRRTKQIDRSTWQLQCHAEIITSILFSCLVLHNSYYGDYYFNGDLLGCLPDLLIISQVYFTILFSFISQIYGISGSICCSTDLNTKTLMLLSFCFQSYPKVNSNEGKIVTIEKCRFSLPLLAIHSWQCGDLFEHVRLCSP